MVLVDSSVFDFSCYSLWDISVGSAAAVNQQLDAKKVTTTKG